jgi:hypothetical protein
MSTANTSDGLLKEILEGMNALRKENSQLATAIDAINGRVNMLAGVKQLQEGADGAGTNGSASKGKPAEVEQEKTVEAVSQQYEPPPAVAEAPPRRASVSKTSKIILTSYPHQAGVDPLPMDWGNRDPVARGPVVVSRHPSTIRRRNGTLWLLVRETGFVC